MTSLLDRLAELQAEATERPWSWTQHERGPWQVGTVVDDEERAVGGYVDLDDVTPVDLICESGDDAPSADADLIVAAVNALPVLLRIARAAEAHADRRGAGIFCGGGVTTCETCVGSCGIEEYYELRESLAGVSGHE